MTAGAAGVIFVLLSLVAFYYRRTHRAYQKLVRKSQQWAEVGIPEERSCAENPEAVRCEIPSGTAPDSADRVIMDKIEQLMNEKRLYIHTDLSLDGLAAELGVDRRHVSGAINACTRKNFFAYLNEYRVKEAIRIMSDAENRDLTIDAVAFESGFNDRKTFHRVFKQFTGLTPGAFRESM